MNIIAYSSCLRNHIVRNVYACQFIRNESIDGVKRHFNQTNLCMVPSCNDPSQLLATSYVNQLSSVGHGKIRMEAMIIENIIWC